VERVEGVEPSSSVWKTEIITAIRYPLVFKSNITCQFPDHSLLVLVAYSAVRLDDPSWIIHRNLLECLLFMNLTLGTKRIIH
jgi:hypothetical protein